jgi:cytochrome c1
MQRMWFIAAGAFFAVASATATEDVTKSGKQLFEQYCASCHGESGRGDGPVANSLSVEVPDLTRLAQRHRSFFDREQVERIIDGRHVIGAHGTRTMPVWGEDFSRAQLGNPDAERGTRTVIVRLADYVWQLQRAASPESSTDRTKQ